MNNTNLILIIYSCGFTEIYDIGTNPSEPFNFPLAQTSSTGNILKRKEKNYSISKYERHKSLQ
jgi:hypothetical protein